MSRGVQALLRIGRNTRDLDRALAFYRDALGFRVDDADASPPAWTRLARIDATPSRTAYLSLGAQHLEFTEFPDAEPYPADGTSCDLAFQHCAIVVSDMDATHARATQHGAKPITRGGPQTLPPATGSVTAWKFRDPDGHPLELIRFPPGTGDPVWQTAQGNGPTLGIDHSAISVGDVERSIGFYQALGMRVAARGVNRGTEQQRLDGLDGVEVDVIALQGQRPTPHLELLRYRAPRGRPASLPVTAVAADRLVLSIRDLHAALASIARLPAHADSRGDQGGPDGSRIASLRDPDGHHLVLT